MNDELNFLDLYKSIEWSAEKSINATLTELPKLRAEVRTLRRALNKYIFGKDKLKVELFEIWYKEEYLKNLLSEIAMLVSDRGELE